MPEVPFNALLTEDGDALLTEDGDFILVEGGLVTSAAYVITLPVNCALAGKTRVIDRVREYFAARDPALQIRTVSQRSGVVMISERKSTFSTRVSHRGY